MMGYRLVSIGALASMLLALTGCGAPQNNLPPTDSDLSLYNSTARLEFDHGSIPFAVAGYAKALNRARVIDDPAAITEAAYNLAICQAAMGDYSAAERCLAEAEHELSRTGGASANVLLAEARISLLQHQSAIAARLAQGVLTRPDAKPSDEQRLQAHIIAGLAACQLADATAAQNELAEAATLGAHVNDYSSQAAIAGLGGEVHLLADDYTSASSDFDRQAGFHKSAHQYRDMNRALAKAGQYALRAGNPATAADRLYRAARAAVARNDSEAPTLIDQARSAAALAHNDALIRLTNDLAALITVPASQPATEPAQ